MKDKLEPNMYVRTKDGIIDKVTIDYKGKCNNPNCNCKHVSCQYDCYDKIDIIKASHNIIDILEVGDYVNGEKVIRIDKDPFIKGQINLWTNTITSNYWGDISLSPIIEKDIKSIVTKEMYSSVEYRVETN